MATVSGSGGGDPVPERATRIRMTGTQRRQQLIEIGRALFAERGYEATSIEEIAQRANVSKPVVYEHFGGKEGLYAVVVDREMSRLLEMITSSLSQIAREFESSGLRWLCSPTWKSTLTDSGYSCAIRLLSRQAEPTRASSTTRSVRWATCWRETSPDAVSTPD